MNVTVPLLCLFCSLQPGWYSFVGFYEPRILRIPFFIESIMSLPYLQSEDNNMLRLLCMDNYYLSIKLNKLRRYLASSKATYTKLPAPK